MHVKAVHYKDDVWLAPGSKAYELYELAQSAKNNNEKQRYLRELRAHMRELDDKDALLLKK